jgi:flagellar biosynthesis/type III secretory pathway ATPase
MDYDSYRNNFDNIFRKERKTESQSEEVNNNNNKEKQMTSSPQPNYKIVELANTILLSSHVFSPKKMTFNGVTTEKRQVTLALTEEQVNTIQAMLSSLPNSAGTLKIKKMEKDNVSHLNLTAAFIKVKDKRVLPGIVLDNKGRNLNSDPKDLTLAHVKLMAVPYSMMGRNGVSLQLIKLKTIDGLPSETRSALEAGRTRKENLFESSEPIAGSLDDEFNT